MSHPLRFEELWDSASKQPKGPAFDPANLQGLPEGARRYLQHSIPIGESLRSAVRLRMNGEIKLKDWYTFSEEQVIDWSRGMIWQETVRVHGLPICGGDSYLDGEGAMRWKLLGILPVVSATGIDITRSAAGRVNIESIWLPSVLCRDGISLTASDSPHLHARFSAHNEIAEVEYTVDENGGLQSVCMPRWGNPEAKSSTTSAVAAWWKRKAPSLATPSPPACEWDGISAHRSSTPKESYSGWLST